MRTSIAAIAAATTMLVAGASAEAATVFASAVYIDAGTGQNTADAQRFGPGNALGATDANFYSLGLGGGALFTFGSDILGPGAVVEVTFNCSSTGGTCGNYPETAAIYGVTGPFNLVADGLVGGVQNYDLSGLSLTFIDSIPNGLAQGGFSFDTGGMTYAGLFIRDTSTFGDDGFDVASVSATPAPVPLPSAAVLLAGALGGLGFARRRRA